MATQTTTELVAYYRNLLIMQYANKTRAGGTIATLAAAVIMPQTSIQQVTFSLAPTAGAFTLYYGAVQSSSIAWNASAATIQATLRLIAGLEAVIVGGSVASKTLTIVMAGVAAPAVVLTLGANTLVASAVPVSVSVVDVDKILPLAVQDGYDIRQGSVDAVGVQLDVIGKYANVRRTGFGLDSDITLGDADYLTLIRFAVIVNTAQSDLATIQDLLDTFFPGQIYVSDYQNMRLGYFVSTAIGSLDLLRVLISQNLLPRPMTVQLSVLYGPSINGFFAYRTYTNPLPANRSPFNTYADYHMDRPWLSYAYSVI